MNYADLDFQVGKALGMDVGLRLSHRGEAYCVLHNDDGGTSPWNPSTDWLRGGPLVDTCGVLQISRYEKKWCVSIVGGYGEGESPLVATMRAIVNKS